MNEREFLTTLTTLIEDIFDRKFDQKFDEKFDERFKGIDERFRKIDERFRKMDERFDRMDERFNRMDERFNKFEAVTKVSFAQLDSRLSKVELDVRDIKLDIENSIKPDIRLLAEHYVPAARRYETEAADIKSMKTQISLLNTVVAQHSEKLSHIS